MRKKWSGLALKWKVFAYLLGFCSILLLILWLFQTVLLDSFYRNIRIMEIKNQASIIEANINQVNLSEMINTISQQREVSVEILNLKGEMLQRADSPRALPFIPLSPQEKINFIQQASNQNGQFIQTQSFPTFTGKAPKDNFNNGQFILFMKLVSDSDGNQLVIYMSSMITPVTATVTTLRAQLWVITGILFILSVGLALLISRKVSKPIEEINNSAKLLAKGDYEVEFHGEGFLEIEELSHTLNTAANELSQVDKLRKELLANVSHDLRTPLSLIYGYAEVMHDFPEEITQEQTQIIMEESSRLTRLVNDLLDISKLEQGRQSLQCKEWNLTKAILQLQKSLGGLMKKDGYLIEFNYDLEVFVVADESKLTQAMYNLLINSLHYSGDSKKVCIEQCIREDRVEIAFADSGVGMTADEVPHIWERYYRGNQAHKRAIEGTGLGLSIVKKVMDLHQIEYGVESEVAKGSRFWFRIPYTKCEP